MRILVDTNSAFNTITIGSFIVCKIGINIHSLGSGSRANENKFFQEISKQPRI